jgi:hypothetical protein
MARFGLKAIAAALSIGLAFGGSARADDPPNKESKTITKTTVAKTTTTTTTKKAVAQPAQKVKKQTFLGSLFGNTDEQTPAESKAETTFKFKNAVKVQGASGSIVGIARGPNDTIVALAGAPRYGRVAGGANGAEVQIYSAEGKLIRNWKVPFSASAVTSNPAGEIIVAGDGKIAKYDAEGKSLSSVDAPHVANLLKDKTALLKQAEARKKSMIDLYKNQVVQLKKQLELQAKRNEENAKNGGPTQNFGNQYDQMIASYEKQVKAMTDRPVESFVSEITGQIKSVNAVAASKDYIFLTCGETKGYGYTVWRMNSDFSNAKSVLTGLSGCCGQMDVQCCEDCLLVAENSRKRVGVYNFEGKPVRSFGKDGREGVGEGFGGCCNPMNTFPSDDGAVLTAESEGFVKRFDKNGKFVELVAHATLTGGCKNVAVASSKDGKRIYLMDLPGSRFLVFERKVATSSGLAN